MKCIFNLVAFLLFFNFSFSQKLTFDIFLFGKVIGHTNVERNLKNDSLTLYTLNSSSQAQILFVTRKIALHYDIVYKRKQLISSYSKSTRNDEAQVTTIMWLGNKYLMKRQDGTFHLNNVVDCSTVRLFFEEPCDTHYIFSERLGEYREIKKYEDGLYQAEMKDGLTYFYHYKSGKLVELEMRKGLLGSVFLRPARVN